MSLISLISHDKMLTKYIPFKNWKTTLTVHFRFKPEILTIILSGAAVWLIFNLFIALL